MEHLVNAVDRGGVLHELAFIGHLNGNQECREFLKFAAGTRAINQVITNFTGQDKIETLRNYCITNIAEYVKKNPKVSEKELIKFIENEVQIFSKAVSLI